MKKLFLFILLSLTFLCPINNTKAITTQEAAAALIIALPLYTMGLFYYPSFLDSKENNNSKRIRALCILGGLGTSAYAIWQAR